MGGLLELVSSFGLDSEVRVEAIAGQLKMRKEILDQFWNVMKEININNNVYNN
jgi:hypothetical protein